MNDKNLHRNAKGRRRTGLQLCHYEGRHRRPKPGKPLCGFHELRLERGLPMNMSTAQLRQLATEERVCTYERCERLRKRAGARYCDAHQRRIDRGWPIDLPIRGEPATCTYRGCIRPHQGQGLCNAHLLRLQRGRDMDAPIREVQSPIDIPDTCTWKDCNNSHYARKFCQLHYNRQYNGVSMDVQPRAELIPGVSTKAAPHGYVLVYAPSHPNAKSGWVQEHRYVMEQRLGRMLFRHENVHHKNGDRSDNRSDNLEVWVVSQPSGQRVEDRIEHARWILAHYGDSLERGEYRHLATPS